MGDDDAAARSLRQRIQDVLVRQAVEAVAPHSLHPQRAGQRGALRQPRHTPMEGRVEARRLGEIGKTRGHGLDARHRAAQMERRERR